MIRIKIANYFFLIATLTLICCGIWDLFDNVIYLNITFSKVVKVTFWLGLAFYVSPLVGIYEKFIKNNTKY